MLVDGCLPRARPQLTWSGKRKKADGMDKIFHAIRFLERYLSQILSISVASLSAVFFLIGTGNRFFDMEGRKGRRIFTSRKRDRRNYK
ncbi:hypothetical protein GLW04_03125 [Halobacillus litoralis]|uniref:Uncharacterized protein n=1 Tax=Halobacillus litoralis TaxID=45668 RepID=A0A845DQN7_9BACI|nr:hypothetical protein [Halobacillus litoralis]MYL18865.1 hypothetical protein [Halobacillus litoralis]